MKIRRTNESRVSLELCEQDLSALKVEYKNLNFDDENTKELLYSILKRVSKEFYCDIDSSSKIIVDSSKSSVLKLTLLKERENKFKRMNLRCSHLIYEFFNCDSLLNAAYSCNGEILLKESSLYEKDGIYRLIIFPDGDFSSCLILNEFCDKIYSTDEKLYVTKEHWSSIISCHALSSLSLRYVF